MIGILTDPGVGGTFLTWSIHYLRGDCDYFLVEDDSYVPVTENPLTSNNAHNFTPNQPNRGPDNYLNKLYQIVTKLQDINSNGIVYLHQFAESGDTQTGIDYLSQVADKIILVSSKNLSMYHNSYYTRSGKWLDKLNNTSNPDIIYDATVEEFFANSNKIWQDLKLVDVWDKREFIALNFNFTKQDSIDYYFDCTLDHYRLEVVELFNLSSYIIDVFKYLDIPINEQRYSKWKTIYHEWQEIHRSRLLFSWYFPQIIDYTINGYSLDLARFNLDLVQEAAIQQHLIFNHNLNFKTWQLEKFTNTKHLHELLEINTHDISNYKHLH